MIKRFLLCCLALTGCLGAEPLEISLPTENHYLFTGQPEKFYMYVDRTFEKQTSKPWQAGGFGFVRTPIRIHEQVVMSQFHEGIDIAPMKRDAAGNPLDLVMSIAKGTVVHTSPVAGRSNYGKYVVVEHDWENSKVYSLYAHLSEITAQIGDQVEAGTVLAKMGYTGAGLNRTRAHCHLEVALLMSTHYENWHKTNYGSRNYHGIYNGMNLAGIDVAALFLAHKENPELTFSQFVLSRPAQFKVTIPATAVPLDFLTRYPWMYRGDTSGVVSWEIAFAPTGHVISFLPSERPVSAPVVSHIRPSDIPQRLLTRGLLTGEGNQVSLSHRGKQLVSLVTDDFPIK